MPPSEKTFKIIWGQFAARCALCRKHLIRKTGLKGSSLVGEVAHIIGETDKAARGSESMPLNERNEPENLLLLCREDHKLVDDDEALYTITKLHTIREDYLHWLGSRLTETQPWRTNISQHCYINLPRLCELGQIQGHSVDLSEYKGIDALSSLGWELNRILLAFEEFLPKFSLSAIPLEFVDYNHEGYVGSLVSFDRERFRTKNIPGNSFEVQKYILRNHSGGLEKDPHIYTERTGGWRLILPIDPKWITTTTAFVLFRGGQSTFAGLARVTKVDYENSLMFGTPLTIGTPRGPLD